MDSLSTGYEYLWDGSSPGWVLAKEAGFPGELFIYNRQDDAMLKVDDPELKAALCDKMLSSGCDVIEEF